ncbi:hypothetical protein [Alistipes onderdonkii]|uniref:hypothetical protein n=1 Tax=Alistipes onderdonkii TaxID=328813 RepID=UPI00117864EF|nr:hypothetical protein [Alistipes onderdonkii]
MVVEKTAPYPKSHPNPTRKCSRMDAPGAQKKTIDDQSVVFFGYRLAVTPQHAVYQYPPENNRFTRTFNPQSGFAAPPDNRVSRSTNTTETDIKQAGAASRAQNRTKTTAEGRPAGFNPVYQNGRDPNA